MHFFIFDSGKLILSGIATVGKNVDREGVILVELAPATGGRAREYDWSQKQVRNHQIQHF